MRNIDSLEVANTAQLVHQNLQYPSFASINAKLLNDERSLKLLYKPDPSVDLALAKVGIFLTMNFEEQHKLGAQNKLPKSYIEIQHSNFHALSSDNFQKHLLRTVRTKTKTIYSGSRRQSINRFDVTFYNSQLTFTEHALKRLYERSPHRGLTSDDLFVQKSMYLDYLDAYVPYLTPNEETNTLDERLDIVFPFKESGAFLCSLATSPSDPIEKMSFRPYTKNSILDTIVSPNMTIVVAHTYISREMMSANQKEVFDLVLNEECELAAKRMSEMKTHPNRLKRHFTG